MLFKMFFKSQWASCFISPHQALISFATLVSALKQVGEGGLKRLGKGPRMPTSAKYHTPLLVPPQPWVFHWCQQTLKNSHGPARVEGAHP